MEYPYINHKDFDPARISKSAVESKTSKPIAGAPGIQYSELKTDYCYAIKDSNGKSCDLTSQFVVKTPLLTAPDGISMKKMPSGNTSASLPTIFNFNDQEVVEFIKPREFGPDMKTVVDEGGFFDKLYYACVDKVAECRAQIPALMRKGPDITNDFVAPLQWNRNATTHQIDFTRPPKKFIPLVNHSASYGDNKPTEKPAETTVSPAPQQTERKASKMTQFRSPVKLPNGNYIEFDWNDLMGCELKYFGFLRIKKIYIGTKISIQMELESVVVVGIRKIDTLGRQLPTLQAIESDKETHDIIESQIKALGFMDKMIAEQSKPKRMETKTEMKLNVTNTGIMVPTSESLPGMPAK